MRCLAIALALVCCAPLMAQEADPNVSLLMRASRTPTVLAELAKQTNLKFETAILSRNDVLVLSVKDVPLSQVMGHIATVTASAWKKIDGGYRLVPDTTQRQRQQIAEEKVRVDGLNADLKKRYDAYVKSLKPKTSKPSTDKVSAEEAMIGIETSSPGSGAILELLVGVDRRVLASIGKGDRIVFSTGPTAMQRSLGSNAISIIDGFVTAHNQGISAKKQAQNMAADDPEFAKLPDFIKKMAMKGTERIEGATKALLIVSKQSFIDMLSCELRLYDKNGKTLHSETTQIGGGDFTAMLEMADGIANPGKAKKPESITTQTPIEYSEDAKALATMGAAQMGQGKVNIPAATLAKIYSPEQYDPLSFATSDELLATAKFAKLQLIANIPDSAESMMTTMFGGGTKKTVETFLTQLNDGKEMKRIEEPGWLTVVPAKPEFARQNRLDRDALGVLMRAAQSKGVVSLDDVATYALSAADPMEGGIGQLYLMGFVPGAIQQGMEGITNWDVVRFYGTLPLQARIGLKNGNRIGLYTLDARQSRILSHLIFGAGGHLEVTRAGEKPAPTDYLSKMMMSFGGAGGGNDYLDEPTEALPTGLPGSGYIEMDGANEPTINPVPLDGEVMSASMGALGPSELGMFKMLQEDKNFAAYSSFLPKFDRVRVGERTRMNLHFRFTPNISLSETLLDHRLDNSSPIMSIGSLPKSFSDQIDAKMAELKKSPFGSMIGMGMAAGRGQIKP